MFLLSAMGKLFTRVINSLYLDDIEELFMRSGLKSLDNSMFEVFMLLYADDVDIFANTAEELQNSLDALLEYCNK